MNTQLTLICLLLGLSCLTTAAQAQHFVECSNTANTVISLERNSEGGFSGNAVYNYQSAKVTHCAEQGRQLNCSGLWSPKNQPMQFTAIYLGNGFIDASLLLPNYIGGGKTVKVPCIAK